MRVGAEIAALRGDRSLQSRAQAAQFAVRAAWRRQARVAPVLADVEAFGQGARLSDCRALAELFAAGEAAARFVDGFCTAFAVAIMEEPFGQLPFRHGFDGVGSTLLLAHSGAARLTLQAQEPGEAKASGVSFSDAERWDAVIAGAAIARWTERGDEGSFGHRRQKLGPGSRATLDLRRQALFIERVDRRLVTLRLQREMPAPGPVREYSLADGRLARQSAGGMRESRQQMMLALLGRMKRKEAAPLIGEMALEPGPDALRWHALREALALDTAIGFAALSRIARSPIDTLAAPAGALRAQLIEAHPVLREFGDQPCQG